MRYSYYMVSQLALVVRHFLIFMKIKILWLLLATNVHNFTIDEQEQEGSKNGYWVLVWVLGFVYRLVEGGGKDD